MKCKKCNIDIEEQLYKRNICKPCSREVWNKNRAIRKQKGVLKVNKMTPEYHSEYRKKWVKENKHKVIQYSKKSRDNYPEKYKARYLLNSAVNAGLLKKLPCRDCGDLKSEAHHENYNLPLNVIWLCKKHHVEIHKNKK